MVYLQQKRQEIFFALFLASTFLVPGLVLAAPTTFRALMELIVEWVNVAIPVIITFAMAAFLYGLMRLLLSAGDSKKYSEGKDVMIIGIISLFIIVATWAILEAAQRTIFGTTVQNTNITNPVNF
ncbi:MAG: hypothetical protein HGA67_03875 [Candidatus Yonathbacteria bacterium]|nr:hypothetical protein [Candidatus Yonathbacteria bacterium]